MKLEQVMDAGCPVLIGEYRGGGVEKISMLDKVSGRKVDRSFYGCSVEPCGGWKGVVVNLWPARGSEVVVEPTCKKGDLVAVYVSRYETLAGAAKCSATGVYKLE